MNRNCEKTEVLSWAEVDLRALAHNIRELRGQLPPATRIMAVVKKNAYGHGAVPVAKAATAAGADWLGVYSPGEGLELRRAGITAPVLIFGGIPCASAVNVIGSKLTPSLFEPELAVALNAAAREMGTTVSVHIKIDTGLNRSGVSVGDAADFFKFMAGLKHIKIGGLYTHFASADEPDEATTKMQLERFLDVAANFPGPRLLHAANSAATLRFPETHLDLVRAGIAIYGSYPSPVNRGSVYLHPVLSLKSRVTRLHWIKPSEGVSYGLTWTAKRDALLALVPFGYGDGLPRLLSNRGQVLIHGHRAPIRGRICMDQCVVDVTKVPEVKVGDEVVLLGRQERQEISADEVAKWAGTISYEILTRIPTSLRRIYIA